MTVGRQPANHRDMMIRSSLLLFAVTVAFGAAAGTTTGAPATASGPRNVIVETDMDASDAMALLYLLHRADVKVTAIVVDGDGEARCPRGATNALSLAALAGKPDIPVGCGRPRPLKGTHVFPKGWRDAADNLWGLPRPAKPARPQAGSGERVFRAALQSAPGRVDVLTLGPPTELAAVLLRGRPALSAKIRSVTMMGGAVGGGPREHHLAPDDQEPACRMELLRRWGGGREREEEWRQRIGRRWRSTRGRMRRWSAAGPNSGSSCPLRAADQRCPARRRRS